MDQIRVEGLDTPPDVGVRQAHHSFRIHGQGQARHAHDPRAAELVDSAVRRDQQHPVAAPFEAADRMAEACDDTIHRGDERLREHCDSQSAHLTKDSGTH